jgi:hypothetical protein
MRISISAAMKSRPKGEWSRSLAIKAFMRKNKYTSLNTLQAYFNRRVMAIVTKHGKRMEGWDEILYPDLPKSIVIQSWQGQKSLADAAREGYSGILSAGYYLDLMEPAGKHYVVDPLKGRNCRSHPGAAEAGHGRRSGDVGRARDRRKYRREVVAAHGCDRRAFVVAGRSERRRRDVPSTGTRSAHGSRRKACSTARSLPLC